MEKVCKLLSIEGKVLVMRKFMIQDAHDLARSQDLSEDKFADMMPGPFVHHFAHHWAALTIASRTNGVYNRQAPGWQCR
jgi:hypothetical protein